MVKWIREWTTDAEVGVQVCCRGTGYESMEGGGHLEDEGGVGK